jgi:hypothetical protein
MSEYVIGVDPDSDKHGVAVYQDGRLIEIEMMYRYELTVLAIRHGAKVSIENVLANNFIYTRNNKQSKAAQSKVGISVGRCQQAQAELMRDLDRAGIVYELRKPTKDNWAKDRKRFELVTGWGNQSNEDTRSAAYFGFIAL